jgi:hypothetical protein
MHGKDRVIARLSSVQVCFRVTCSVFSYSARTIRYRIALQLPMGFAIAPTAVFGLTQWRDKVAMRVEDQAAHGQFLTVSPAAQFALKRRPDGSI